MNRLTKAALFLLSLMVALGLSACGGSGTGSVTQNQNNTTEQKQPEKPKEPTQLERENGEGGSFSAFTKTLQDGRVVQCVGLREYASSAVDCDFAAAK